MKNTTQQICEILEKPELLEWYGKLKDTNSSYTYEETTIEESHAEFVRFSKLILGTAKSGLLDTITFKKRGTILTHVTGISTRLKHCEQYSYDMQQCVQQFNSIIDQTFEVSAILAASNLFLESLGIRGKKQLTDDLTQTREQYNDFLDNLSESKTYFTEFDDIDTQIRQIQENIITSEKNVTKIQEKASQLLAQIEDHKNQSDTCYQDVTKIAGDVKSLLISMQKYVEDAEVKRLGIDTFSSHIEDHKKNISDLENRAKAIIEKEKTINELIRSAEQALNLKSAEGISAAFASQYVKASDWRIVGLWLSTSFVFIILTIVEIFWLTWKHFTIDSHGISSIIARIVAVAVTVTAATFCAKQYTKQKNIAEDYAYKAVLSKSIIAFTDKLNEKSGENSDIVAEYLQKVLAEIHQDPLRQRNTKEEQVPVITTNDLLSKLPELLKELMEITSKR